MITATSRPATGEDVEPEATRLFTVAELSRQVGMAPRTIRAYQSRELLEPPARQGRAAYYSVGHLQRLRQITSLQRQGFNLVAIGAILKSRGQRPADEKPAATVRRLFEECPHLADAVARVDRLAEELVRATCSCPGPTPGRVGVGSSARAHPKGADGVLPSGLAGLLTEAFRLAVERNERKLIRDPGARPSGDRSDAA